ncbi:unknown [Bacteroides sp. CAG:633]|nr:unknown [Bacteroides sp. CAG:633]
MIVAYGKPYKIRLTLAPLSTLSTSKYMPFLFSCNAYISQCSLKHYSV